MERKPHKLKEIVDFQMSDDGTMFAFKIVTADDQSLDIEIPAGEMGALVRFFVMNGAELERTAFLNGADNEPRDHLLTPIPTKGIGLAGGAVHSHPLLVTRLFGFDLAFEVEPGELQRLAAEFAQAALLMAANTTKPQ